MKIIQKRSLQVFEEQIEYINYYIKITDRLVNIINCFVQIGYYKIINTEIDKLSSISSNKK